MLLGKISGHIMPEKKNELMRIGRRESRRGIRKEKERMGYGDAADPSGAMAAPEKSCKMASRLPQANVSLE
jgi:hypothetical protein